MVDIFQYSKKQSSVAALASCTQFSSFVCLVVSETYIGVEQVDAV